MLVLTRKHQEKIRIGESITITVLRTKGKAVRLGIEAPADVPVIRGELAFEGPRPEPTPEIGRDKSQDAPAPPTVGERTRVRAPRAESSWTTDSHPHAPSRGEAVDVSLRRVTRDRAAQVLPKSPQADHPFLADGARCGELVAGPRPLRGMLDARSSAM
ncbi:MAG: hypothetical protein A2W31_05200 [Planctomycetes bacterium RBG_16_64_10]|nr:MAG: hypothetical protein A2W31_05200 [Planctomycetes bacterium RBG_16_64_10]